MEVLAKMNPNGVWKCVGILIAVVVFCLGMPTGYAAKLSDLIKQPSQLYLPSQIIPGKTALFTIKSKPGRHVKVVLSRYAESAGTPMIAQEAVIPVTGVLQLPIAIPDNPTALGDKQIVSAWVWSNPDQSDRETVQILSNAGTPSESREVAVGTEPERGGFMLLPGDTNMAGIMRSLTTLQEVGDDPRKRQLLDEGTINRKRELDKNLVPVSQP